MHSDPIADFLTRIRNAQMVSKEVVSSPSSKIKVEIAKIFESEGYITGYSLSEVNGFDVIRLSLKYDTDGSPVIDGLKRLSKPGLRKYCGADDIVPVRGGLGTCIVSTSKGLMTDRQAREVGVGGELICSIW